MHQACRSAERAASGSTTTRVPDHRPTCRTSGRADSSAGTRTDRRVARHLTAASTRRHILLRPAQAVVDVTFRDLPANALHLLVRVQHRPLLRCASGQKAHEQHTAQLSCHGKDGKRRCGDPQAGPKS